MITAIEIFKETEKRHRKVLMPKLYPFVRCSLKNQEEDSSGLKNMALQTLYDAYQNLPEINISCIVGLNGAGKSTLMELVLKIINNFSYSVMGIGHNEKDPLLIYEADIYADLYLNLDRKQYVIQVRNLDLSWCQMIDGMRMELKTSASDMKGKAQILSKFFYTVYLNYGLHSFNKQLARSFQEIHDRISKSQWFDKRFELTENYFIPYIIDPRRNDGIIDINRENRLARQRLTALALLLYSKNKRSLLGGYIPTEIEYSIQMEDEERVKDIFLRGDEEHLDEEQEKHRRMILDTIKNIWEEELLKEILSSPKDIYDLVQSSLNHLTMESISLMREYDDIGDGFKAWFVWGQKDEVKLNRNCRRLVDRIKEDTSYRTSGIRSIINFIKSDKYTGKYSGRISLEKLVEDTPIKTYTQAIEMLPPHFFTTDLYYKKIEGKDEDINIDAFSSGERQLLFSISSIMHHLANLSTIDRADLVRVPYHHVNIIFDEVELYFHPEFQRTFISKVLSYIDVLGLDRRVIRSISVMIATHSPYVLSDVPEENVLQIGDNDDKVDEGFRTFGANIFDMLKNGFFMKSSIGELASDNIKDCFNIYYDKNPETQRDGFIKNKEKFKYLTDKVGDEYLGKILKRMYQELESKYIQDELKEKFINQDDLDRRIREKELELMALRKIRDEKGSIS